MANKKTTASNGVSSSDNTVTSPKNNRSKSIKKVNAVLPENSDLKILLSYHKKDVLFSNDFLVPIHVGRACCRKKSEENNDFKLLDALQKDMIGDDTGDNISLKNGSYNEMTSVYWAWKNYNKLGNPKYIGFMHYRRHFLFEDMPSAYYETNDIKSTEAYLNEELNCNKQYILRVLGRNNFICTKPYYKDSVYKHYKDNHDITQLDTVIKILKETHPEYADSCDKYINGHNTYFCNMFIFPKETFFKYCEFIFSILGEYEKYSNIESQRLFSSERLTGIFIQHLLDNGQKGAFFPTNYLEERITIPVVFATDKNYLFPTSVAITSLLENAKQATTYDIYVMVNRETFDLARTELEMFNKNYKNCIINIVNMENMYADIKMSLAHITQQTYYRLMLPELLGKYNKCIYLDSDIIVKKDLTLLYRNNVDDYYIAGVKAAGYHFPVNKAKEHAEMLSIASNDLYVNAGVLLLNLGKMRNDGLQKIFHDLIKKNFPSQDQDILNSACYPKIKVLPYEYNFMTKYIVKNSNPFKFNFEAENVYSKKEIQDAIGNPWIIHYADKIKPWHNCLIPFAQEWQNYSLLSPKYSGRKARKVSVIVPVYNTEEFIPQCMDSVLSQTLSDIEVICINDGSTDNSLKILEAYAEKDDRIILIDKKNEGVAAARNYGLKVAKSKYVAFMDPDDFYPSDNILETLYAKATEHKVSICGGSWSEYINGDYKYEFPGLNSDYVFKKEGLVLYSDYQFDFGFQRFIYSLDLIRKNNIAFPNLLRFQDPPFFAKCMTAAKQFYAIEPPAYCYRLGHQTPGKWSHKKRNDQILGVIDVLRISAKYNLGRLHYYAYQRLLKDNDIFVEEALCGENNYMLELLIRANTAVNRTLLKGHISSVNENFCIKPLKEAVDKLQYRLKVARTEVGEVRKSKSYKLGRFLTWLPRKIKGFFKCLKMNGFKYTMTRLFKGKKGVARKNKQ